MTTNNQNIIRIATFKKGGGCEITEYSGNPNSSEDVRAAMNTIDEEYLKQEALKEKSTGSKTPSKIALGLIMTGIGVTPGLSCGNPTLAIVGGAVGAGIFFYGMIKGGHFK